MTLCGNAMKTPNEGCDDGNISDNDGCSSTCVIEANSSCNLTIHANVCDLCGNN